SENTRGPASGGASAQEREDDRKVNLVTAGLIAAADDEHDSGPSRPYERYVIERILTLLGSPAVRIELWDGFGVEGTAESRLVGTVRINTRSALKRIITNVMVGLGDE